MSKKLDSSMKLLRAIPNASSKFTEAAREGARILPVKTKDRSIPVRIDAGHFDPATKKLNVVLQVNSQARGGLQDWAKKKSTHGKLATAQFDTSAADKDAEFDRMFNSLETAAKDTLKDSTDNNAKDKKETK